MINAALELTGALGLPDKTTHICMNAIASWVEDPGQQLMDSCPSEFHTVLIVVYPMGPTLVGLLWHGPDILTIVIFLSGHVYSCLVGMACASFT